MYISLTQRHFLEYFFIKLGSKKSMFSRLSLLLTLIFTMGISTVPAQAQSGLFNSTEFKSTELSAFKKWASHHKRFENGRKPSLQSSVRNKFQRTCRRTKNFACVSDAWLNLMESLKGKSQIEQMDALNSHLNKAAYVTDMVNWRQQDYWATIHQFFSKDGDCEDYAIAKYYSLIELGFDPDEMRIVIVEDTNLNIAHAVLAVYLGEKIWVLDNQISTLVPHEKIVHYTPLYSINENAWWLHKAS